MRFRCGVHTHECCPKFPRARYRSCRGPEGVVIDFLTVREKLRPADVKCIRVITMLYVAFVSFPSTLKNKTFKLRQNEWVFNIFIAVAVDLL